MIDPVLEVLEAIVLLVATFAVVVSVALGVLGLVFAFVRRVGKSPATQ